MSVSYPRITAHRETTAASTAQEYESRKSAHHVRNEAWRRSLTSIETGLWLRSMAVDSNHVISKDTIRCYNLE
jgi:hypothetical protein